MGEGVGVGGGRRGGEGFMRNSTEKQLVCVVLENLLMTASYCFSRPKSRLQAAQRISHCFKS